MFTDAAGISLPGCNHGLGHPQGSGLAGSETDECRLLRRSIEGGPGTLQQARDFQRRSSSQFAGFAFTGVLPADNIKISMDSPGRFFIERLWRSFKYESTYLNDFETGSELCKGVGRWFDYYSNNRHIRPLQHEPRPRHMGKSIFRSVAACLT
jgi:putative transposase